jgi:YHS domain-containing protein
VREAVMKVTRMCVGGVVLALLVCGCSKRRHEGHAEKAPGMTKTYAACPRCGTALSVADCSSHETVDCPECGNVEVPPACCPPGVGGGIAVAVPPKAAQTMCPVMEGRKIDKTLYVDHEGKRIYFCCAGCPDTFKKDPGEYMAKLEAEGVTLDEAQR